MNSFTIYRYSLLIMAVILPWTVSCAAPVRNIYPLARAYYNKQKLTSELEALAAANPGLVQLRIIGTTEQGNNPIYALQISTGAERIPVLIIGQHHGDEVMGVEISMALAEYLTAKKDEAKAKELLERYAFWIVPTLNPDAWDIVSSGRFEWKRKNITDTNYNGRLEISKDGVDLNRNYPTFWQLDKQTSVKNVNYKGSAPASEAETKAIIKLANEIHFAYGFFYHSSISGNFNEKIYLPRPDRVQPGQKSAFLRLQEMAETYARAVPRDYASGTYTVYKGVTSKVGNARNYFFNTWGTLAMDIEVCGINRFGTGIEHPNTEMREKVVSKNLQALIRTLLLQQTQ